MPIAAYVYARYYEHVAIASMGKRPKPITTPLPIVRSIVSYDPLKGDFRWKIPMDNGKKKAGDIAGTFSGNKEYRRVYIFGQDIREQRLAWFMHYGEDPGPDFLVDHKNGNSLDNRIENLRLATDRENSKNRKRGSNNTTGFKGVTKNKDGSFDARIYINEEHKYLGSFKTIELAANAYKEASIKYHGEWGRDNDLAR
jgi:hypothetical protein